MSHLWALLPPILVTCLVGLVVFSGVLEFRAWVVRTSKESQRLELSSLLQATLEAEALEREVLELLRLDGDLVDWRLAKVVWAGPLLDVTKHLPARLALRRVGVKEVLGGGFLQARCSVGASLCPASRLSGPD